MRTSRLFLVAAATTALVLPALPASAAHEANNKAELAGEGTTGTAVVNYVEGRESDQWTANARVRGLDAGDYEFVLNGGPTGEDFLVCTFTADGNGSDGCSTSSFDPGGFGSAEIRESDSGDVVASGTFLRRGGQRAA